MDRRRFIGKVASVVAGTAGLASQVTARETAASRKRQRATLVQVTTHRDVAKNMTNARKAFDQAQRDRAGWIVFPEMFLSGYYGEFSQEQVAKAFAQVQDLCRRVRVMGLIGTGWKENGKTFNQIRIVDATGRLAGTYAKKCLCYGEAEWTAPGTTPLIFTVGTITFGTLICNDLWVTPGFSDGPNPHLSLKQARAGAQVIFHLISSGSDQRYRAYHEANHFTRAAEAKCSIVAVNAFKAPEVNATSGVVGTNFEHLVALPRDREVIQTVEFTPVQRKPAATDIAE